MDRMVVIGATGLLGQYLYSEAVSRGSEVVGTYLDHAPAEGRYSSLDITDEREVSALLGDIRPSAVILAAALTSVDYCEHHPSEAWTVNAEGTLNVANACRAVGARLMYVSTDAVFNGQKGSRYYEFDTPDPQTIYGQTKLEGERLTMDADHHNIVARVSVLYGWSRLSIKENFVTWALNNLRSMRPLDLYEDVYSSPTYAPNCAQVLLDMLSGGARGVYHVAGPDCLSRYEMGQLVADTFDLDWTLCRRARAADLPEPRRRGGIGCLDSQKAEAEFGVRMVSFRDGLRAMRSLEGLQSRVPARRD